MEKRQKSDKILLFLSVFCGVLIDLSCVAGLASHTFFLGLYSSGFIVSSSVLKIVALHSVH